MITDAGTYVRLKAKCLTCNLHFVVCTEYPERHSHKTIYCPECGRRGGDFLTYAEPVSGEIWQEVPGNAQLTPDMKSLGFEDLSLLSLNKKNLD